MGALSRLLPGIGTADLTAAAQLIGPPPGLSSGTLPLVSPLAPEHTLASVVWEDVYGALAGLVPVSRAEAMRVPAMSRARHIITGAARIELREYVQGSDTPVGRADEAPWIGATDGSQSALQRMIWTLDDLLFYGWSCWYRTNAAPDASGRTVPLRMDRVPVGQWSVDATTGRVQLDQGAGFRPARSDEVVMIPGPHEGLLSFAAASIRHAADLQRAAGVAASTPAANIVLKQTAGDPLSDDQIDNLLAIWRKARQKEGGGVGFASLGIDVEELGTYDAHLLVEGRNAAAVDLARHASIPADLIDAASEASLTYSNSRDNDRRAIDWGIGSYLACVSSALSQDAVMRRGRSVAFDLEKWLQGTVPGQPVAGAAPATPPTGAAPAAPPAAIGEPAL